MADQVKIDIPFITYYAEERMEDGDVGVGLARLMLSVYRMPPQVWGELLPYSPRWAKGWADNCLWRAQDAMAVRDFCVETGQKTFQALADFTGADVDAAESIDDVQIAGIEPYMRDYTDLGRLHSGRGNGSDLGTFRPGSGGEPDFDIPQPGRYGQSADPGWDAAPLDGGVVRPEPDALAASMGDRAHAILQAEVTLKMLGHEPAPVYEKYLVPALSLSPSVIERNTQEIWKAVNAWKVMADRIKHDNGELPENWGGDAGLAALHRGTRFADYVDYCITQAEWLAKAGDAAVKTLREVRNEFAKICDSVAQQLVQEHQDMVGFLKTAGQALVKVASLDFGGVAEKMLDLLSDAALQADRKLIAAAQMESAVRDVEITAGTIPNIGSLEHEHRDPLRDGSPKSGAWADPDDWGGRRTREPSLPLTG
ncbi:hypothetical protein [Actinoplanes sp. HUAS TT8]|uniref:hypothetical protein n=1 Tax=Actinoplanes sp. HUAS TT8 TaxID=3447453 RepID=UPI003F51CB72